MSVSAKLDQLYQEAVANKWLQYFTIFLRLALSFGFLAAGIVKIIGERFASGLSENHPMGQYLVALHNTGFYYTFIGWVQVLAAVLLLFKRTVLLGALIYLPVILNICILSYAVRFEGSILTSPLMVLGTLYLVCWNYDKVRHILPIKAGPSIHRDGKSTKASNRFLTRFFSAVIAMIIAILILIRFGFDVMPRNSTKDCLAQFTGTNRTRAGAVFCNCIHQQGLPLNESLAKYYQLPNDGKNVGPR